MKNFFAGVIGAAALLSMPASAADIPARMPATVAPSQVFAYDWSGFYTSTSIGAVWQNVDGTYTPVSPADPCSTSRTRAWTGSHAGIQGQWGNWVLGLEGSYNSPLSNKYDSSNAGADCVTSALRSAGSCNARIHDIWTGGGRAGYAFGNWMVYGSGGYATGRIDTFRVGAAGAVTTSSRERHNGWYAGAGIDWLVTRIWWSDLILGVEYRHVDLASKNHPDASGVVLFGSNVSATADMVMAKATFKWVGAGPFNAFK